MIEYIVKKKFRFGFMTLKDIFSRYMFRESEAKAKLVERAVLKRTVRFNDSKADHHVKKLNIFR